MLQIRTERPNRVFTVREEIASTSKPDTRKAFDSARLARYGATIHAFISCHHLTELLGCSLERFDLLLLLNELLL